MRKPAGIHLESVSRHYARSTGTVRAVDGISLHVEAGSTLAITGPSGCGKSTLVALMGGLEVPSGGSVAVGAQAISTFPDRHRVRLRRKEFGFVFQSGNLLPFLTAAENVGLRLALSGCSDDGLRAAELLLAVGLAHEADKLPDALSGGQRQRVAVAVAAVLAHSPRIVIADEPTGSLDAVNAVLLVDVLLKVQRDIGATLVVVTHDPLVAARMDRTIQLSDGRLVGDTALEPPVPGM